MYGYLVGRETHRAITLVVRWLVVLIEFCAVNLGTLGVFLSPNIHIFIHTYAYSSLGPLISSKDNPRCQSRSRPTNLDRASPSQAFKPRDPHAHSRREHHNKMNNSQS